MISQNEVAPPFPRSWREGGLWPGARHQFVLVSALSIVIRSRRSLPSLLHSEQSCSISNPPPLRDSSLYRISMDVVAFSMFSTNKRMAFALLGAPAQILGSMRGQSLDEYLGRLESPAARHIRAAR